MAGTSLLILEIFLVVIVTAFYFFLYYFSLRLLRTIVKKSKHARYILSTKRIIYVCFILVSLTILHGYLNMANIQKKHYVIHTEHTFRNKDSYRIVLIADSHYGTASIDDSLSSLCQQVNTENADLILLLGDIVDENSRQQDMESVFSRMSRLKSNYGTYFIYGNHDRQLLKKETDRAYTQSELVNTIQQNGISILKDASVIINNDILLVGREDYSMSDRQENIGSLLADNHTDNYVIVMDHKPQDYQHCKDQGVNLLVSGHTHNGQVWPMNWILQCISDNDLFYGIEESTDSDFKAIVTSGIGGWALPIRNSSPAEYVVIDIMNQKE